VPLLPDGTKGVAEKRENMGQTPKEEKGEEKALSDKTAVLVNILRTINENVVAALRLLDSGAAALPADAASRPAMPALEAAAGIGFGTVVEGVFDGKGMVGPDGKEYPIPANYASKSKLVEGDLLKLTISPNGAFIFKQIGPIERERLVGTLVHDIGVDEFSVATDSKKYRVLKASVTYFRGAEGDEAVILVPKSSPSRWAAVENIMKKRIDVTNPGNAI
jgi:hypothetical protein